MGANGLSGDEDGSKGQERQRVSSLKLRMHEDI